MLNYVIITDRRTDGRTDKLITSIVQNLTKLISIEHFVIVQERVYIFFVNDHPKFKTILQSHVNDLLRCLYTKL